MDVITLYTTWTWLPRIRHISPVFSWLSNNNSCFPDILNFFICLEHVYGKAYKVAKEQQKNRWVKVFKDQKAKKTYWKNNFAEIIGGSIDKPFEGSLAEIVLKLFKYKFCKLFKQQK